MIVIGSYPGEVIIRGTFALGRNCLVSLSGNSSGATVQRVIIWGAIDPGAMIQGEVFLPPMCRS